MNKNLILWFTFLGFLIIHLTLLQKITLTAWPEMFSYPYLLNHGFVIYRDLIHPYEPLLTFLLAGIYKLFGYSLLTYKLVICFFVISIDLMIFLIAKKLIVNKKLVFLPLLLYLLLQPIFDGNMLWFDFGTTPFILIGLLSFIFTKDEKRFFLLGFFLGVSFFIKQQTILLSMGLLVYLLITKGFRMIRSFSAGFFIPTISTLLVIFSMGSLNDFLFWTIVFPLKWLPKFSGYSQNPNLAQIINLTLVFGPILFMIISSFKKLSQNTKIIFFIFLASISISFPRFSYFHLQPAIAVLAVLLILLINEKKFKFIFVIPLLLIISYNWSNYRPFIGVKQARFYDEKDLKVAEFVASNSKPDDKIYLLGPHSLIYVLSNRLPSKPWVDNFVWYFEVPLVQENFLAGFKKEKVKLFQSQALPGNWFDLGTYKPKKIMNYINENYHQTMLNSELGIEKWIN